MVPSKFGFWCEAYRVHRSVKTTRLVAKLRKHVFESPTRMMEDKFDKFVVSVLIPRLRHPFSTKNGLSVLVFADAIWGHDSKHAAGVEDLTKRLIKAIHKQDLGNTRVIISFIQFGNSVDGRKRLEYLDDVGKGYVL